MEKIPMPEEYKEKGWAKHVQDDEGNFDLSKALSKLDGQESLLGKKHIPTKEDPAEKWQEFHGNVVKNFEDGDYDSVLGEHENKSEMIKALKEKGLTPAQAKYVTERELAAREAGAKSVMEKVYDEDEFRAETLKRIPDEKARAKAKAALIKLGKWEEVQAKRNESALYALEIAADMGVAYDIDDQPGKGGSGDTSNIVSNGKGYSQEYINRIAELESQGQDHDNALRIAKAEYGVKD